MNNGKSILNNLIKEQSDKPKRGEIYRHFKGNYYLVEDIAYDTEHDQEVVVYRALYGECNLYVRDLKMFMENLPGSSIPRFTKMDSLEAK